MSLKRMVDIVKAAGGAKDAPESGFDAAPYIRSKMIK
jgi:hypothetical protein